MTDRPIRRFREGQQTPDPPRVEAFPGPLKGDEPDREGPSDVDTPATYTPGAGWSTSQTSSLSVEGAGGAAVTATEAPGPVFTRLSGDGHSDPEVIWVPTGRTSDGFPGRMVPVTTDSIVEVS